MIDVTFFAVPRPFIKDWKDIQRTAIKSWMKFGNVILCGDEEGIKETADEFGIGHVSIDELTLKASLEAAESLARTKYMCRITADCVLLDGIDNIPDFGAGCISSLRYESPTVVDLDNPSYLSLPIQRSEYVDIHLYERGFYKDVPPIRIGLGGDDSWLSHYALIHGKLIHSKDIVLIHQAHSRDYSRDESTPGYIENCQLVARCGLCVSLDAANYTLEDGKLCQKSLAAPTQ